ncbi:hypothetical protein PVAP13_1KG005300 [Panicum virgatum]|uniref:Uncharacterized protein n=1 Tax=Panicum virgatum TaxID=38727 RepID=A0A8T0X0N2_PANVG|nr:hypothetical protein PVAP13_1KG005300 [Panicum virgatum]
MRGGTTVPGATRLSTGAGSRHGSSLAAQCRAADATSEQSRGQHVFLTAQAAGGGVQGSGIDGSTFHVILGWTLLVSPCRRRRTLVSSIQRGHCFAAVEFYCWMFDQAKVNMRTVIH